MISIFDDTGFIWVRYDEYELKLAESGQRYITPAQNSKLTPYDPMKNAEEMVIDALNAGAVCIKREREKDIQTAVMEFVSKYGLLGFMTALPTTPDYVDYETAFISHNHFIKEESMASKDFAMLFYPFSKPDLRKVDGETELNITDNNELVALVMTFGKMPTSMTMSYLREYSEPYDWIVTQLRDMTFTFMTSILYYEDYDIMDEEERDTIRKGMLAFGGIAPTYRIALHDKPNIVWEFSSLLRSLQMLFSFMLTDNKKPIRLCRHCDTVFIASHVNADYCTPKCKNQYNIYKNRSKSK
jgi:hypothetical protein